MMLKSEHSRHKGDDRIIANDGQQDELDELMDASHKASHGGSLQFKSKEKIAKGDEDDQQTKLIGR